MQTIMQQDPKERISFIYDSVRIEPKGQIGLHQHSSWELSYVITGSGMRLIGNATEPFWSGDVVLVPPDIPHCWYFDGNITDAQGMIANITIGFRDTLLEDCAATFPELSEAISRFKGKRDSAISFTGGKAEEIKSLLLEMRDLDRAARVVPLLRLILLISSPEEEGVISRYHKISREEERINQAKVYMACNLQREITLQDVAAHTGMNRSSFCVFFKKATGKTFTQHLNSLRIDHACHLLAAGNTPIAEACYKSGFNDVPYFNRLFKRIKGMTPTAWASGNGLARN